MITPTTPNILEGFELFIPSHDPSSSVIRLTMSKTGCRLSKAALANLDFPDYVIAFFDYNKKRLMITKGEKNNRNIMKLSKQGNDRNTITLKGFIETMKKVCEIQDESAYFFHGFRPKTQQPTLIFDLAKVMK